MLHHTVQEEWERKVSFTARITESTDDSTYVETLGVSFDSLVFQTEVDAGCRQESCMLCVGITSLSGTTALLFHLLRHELYSGLRVPVLIHIRFLLVSRQKPIETLSLYHFKLLLF